MTVNQELIDFAHYLADLSSKVAQKYFRSQNTGEVTKEDDSPVTKADRGIEELIRQEINKKYPDHGIIGEEFANTNIDADYIWILDPIDGTSSFIIGRPLFGTLIALTYKGQSILGIVNQPITNERWLGIKDQGAFFQGQKINTRNCQNISNSVMCASSSFYFKDEDEIMFKELCKLTKYQKIGGVVYGGDCYSYASLASGFIDIVIDPGLQVYDYAALQPIITEAGGVMTDFQGNDLNLQSNVKLVACANKELHQEVIAHINKYC
ncbi:MAG: histidinol-phosphatase [Rickettsiales bacterium]|nr:histidinol-phosphatase [Rickettsiales bacterium]